MLSVNCLNKPYKLSINVFIETILLNFHRKNIRIITEEVVDKQSELIIYTFNKCFIENLSLNFHRKNNGNYYRKY